MTRLRSILAFFIALTVLTSFRPVAAKEWRVVYFISPACRICQFYTLEMKSLYQEYQTQSIHFEAVVAKSFSQEEIDEFKATYQIPFDVRMDSILQYRYNATVTPEVILLDVDGNVLYRGRIDDSYASIGKRRARTKHHELKDALKAVLKGDSIVVKETTPVGCIIQK